MTEPPDIESEATVIRDLSHYNRNRRWQIDHRFYYHQRIRNTLLRTESPSDSNGNRTHHEERPEKVNWIKEGF